MKTERQDTIDIRYSNRTKTIRNIKKKKKQFKKAEESAFTRPLVCFSGVPIENFLNVQGGAGIPGWTQ